MDARHVIRQGSVDEVAPQTKEHRALPGRLMRRKVGNTNADDRHIRADLRMIRRAQQDYSQRREEAGASMNQSLPRRTATILVARLIGGLTLAIFLDHRP